MSSIFDRLKLFDPKYKQTPKEDPKKQTISNQKKLAQNHVKIFESNESKNQNEISIKIKNINNKPDNSKINNSDNNLTSIKNNNQDINKNNNQDINKNNNNIINQNSNQNSNKTNNNQKNVHINNQAKNQNNNQTKDKNKKLQEIMYDNKVLPKSKPLYEKNDLHIFQYPIITFNDNETIRCRYIIILGNNQIEFINNFVNYCSDISYKDQIRYQAQSLENDDIKPFSIYNIKNIKQKEYYKFICFPEFNLDENIYISKQIFTSFVKIFTSIISKIHYIFFICDEKTKELNINEQIIFYILLNLFDEKIKKDVIFIINSESDRFNNTIKKDEIINNILKNCNENIFKDKFNFLKNCEFFYLNNKIIFEKNDYAKNNWSQLMIDDIKMKMKLYSSPYRNLISQKKINLVESIVIFRKHEIKKINEELSSYSEKELIIWINILIYIKNIFKNDLHFLLLEIYNYFYNNSKNEFKIDCEKISFISRINLNIIIDLLSNVNFSNLKEIFFQNCDIDNKYFNKLGNIFTRNLITLNLSENKISDIIIFNNKNDFPNLLNLNLSNNNISDISPLFKSKIENLKNLNLNHNKINNLNGIENSYFKLLENLDLSYNEIIDINNLENSKMENLNQINLSFNKIKICESFSFLSLKKLNKLDISNNLIEKMNINKLFENIGYNCHNLFIKINKDELNDNIYNIFFEYSNIIIIKFNYLIEKGKLNNFFEKISFKNIQDLIIEGYNYTEILLNKTLKDLKVLDIQNINLEDISFFDKISFLNIDNIKFNANKIRKGFYSLNIFKSIKTKNISIIQNNLKEYDCFLELENPNINLNIIFENFDFLNNNIINGIQKLSISNSNISNLEYLTNNNFKNLKILELKNNFIEKEEVFLQINSYSKLNNEIIIISLDNKYNHNSVKNLYKEIFKMESITSMNNINEKNKLKLNYTSPILFSAIIDCDNLNDISSLSFKSCKKICVVDTNLKNINFLENKNLISLKKLNLDFNLIENINIISDIVNPELNISIIENKINNGLSELDKNLNLKNYKICDINFNLDKEKINHKITIKYTGLVFDYLININKSLDIIKDLNLEKIDNLILDNINLKNIEFLTNKSLYNLKVLNLDNNKIEDISIFQKEKINFNNLKNLKINNNNITKGLDVLTKEFFTKCLFMIINLNYFNKNNKVFISFGKPEYNIEIIINDINFIKNLYENFKNIIYFEPYYDEIKKIIENYISNSIEQNDINKYISNILKINYNSINHYNPLVLESYSYIDKSKPDIYINGCKCSIKSLEVLLDKVKNGFNLLPKINNIKINFDSCNQKFIQYIPFINATEIKFVGEKLNLNFLKNSALANLKNLDLSHGSVYDIKELCDEYLLLIWKN